MATMHVKTEVEITPATVAAELQAYGQTEAAAERKRTHMTELARMKFPAAEGQFVYLTPDAAAAFGALPDMPALVIAAAEFGPPLGLVAFCTATDLIQTARLMSTQIARTVPKESTDAGI